jgi:P27 family predicted phage terminase small subunit
MAGYPGKQGRKLKATTIVDRGRNSNINRTIPKPPDHLSDEGRACWKKLVRVLKDTGLIARVDADALALYCTAYERWLNAEAGLRKHGMLVKTPNGYPIPSPLLTIANKAMAQMTQLLGEFGMTPASRSRLPLAQDSPTKPQRQSEPYRADPRKILEEALN